MTEPPAATDSPVAAARGLSLTYGRGAEAGTVLRNLHLDIPAAGITAITGPSGSGKSTLLFCLAGLEQAGCGQVELLGIDPARTRPGRMARLYREQVGFVFQDYHLIPYLSARRNVELPGLLGRRRDTSQLAAAALEELGLSDHATAQASHLSGGQQQRVALARVLAQQPAVIFADEPTGALDNASSTLVLEALRERADEGAAVVLVTHDPEAAAIADRVLELRDGELVTERVR